MADATPTYTAFWLYRRDPEWRRLSAADQARGKQEFLAALEGRDQSIALRAAYSLVGLRHDADLLLWLHGTDLEPMQQLAVALSHSGLGAYLSTPYTYIGVTAGARYDPEHRPSFLRGLPPLDYICMYPFVKTSEWYLLPYERRRELMAVHGQLGRRYTVPREVSAETLGSTLATSTAVATATQTSGGILTNTVDAFGYGDHEFIVAFESNDPSELARMIEELRTAEVRIYTKVDTPVFLGRKREPAEALAAL